MLLLLAAAVDAAKRGEVRHRTIAEAQAQASGPATGSTRKLLLEQRHRQQQHSPNVSVSLAQAGFELVSEYYVPSRVAAPPQVVPRIIFQTGRDHASALAKDGVYMRKWSEMNPEYEYRFFNDSDCSAFVAAVGSEREREAYRRVRMGASRSDIFRILFLKYVGGVYADTDSEPTEPMRALVPSRASGVAGTYWPFEWMVWERGHVIIQRVAALQVLNVMREVAWHRSNDPGKCHGAHQCVIRVTGPLVYSSAIGDMSHLHGCMNTARLPSPGDCSNASDYRLRTIHVCADDPGGAYKQRSCRAVRHWDCRNSGRKGGCGKRHYSNGRKGATFFDLS